MLPKLYRKQAEAVCDPARITCIESTTKAGKTLGCIIWQIGQIMSGPEGAEHWWIAPVYEQAMMAYREAWKLLRPLPGFKQALADRALLCPGGRRWSFRTADNPDHLYGSAVSSVVLDEASRMKDAAVDAVYSTTTRTRGPMRLIGNVRGRANRHYQWSRKGEAGEPGFAYHRITADDAVAAGVFNADDVEMARRTMPAAIFRELYYWPCSLAWTIPGTWRQSTVGMGLASGPWWRRWAGSWARAPRLAWSMMPRGWEMRWGSS